MAISTLKQVLVMMVVLFSQVFGATNSTDWQQRNYNTVKAIYNTTIYPHNLAFLQNGSSVVPPGLFNANVSGRITPVGNFTGFEDSVEYFCKSGALYVVVGITPLTSLSWLDPSRFASSVKLIAYPASSIR